MSTATYGEFRVVLRRTGLQRVRSKKHETWEKTLPTGEILTQTEFFTPLREA